MKQSSRKARKEPTSEAIQVKHLPPVLFLALLLASASPGFGQDAAAAANDHKGTAHLAGWTNSLGMRFLPVPGTKVLFSIWETRVQDYRAFADHSPGLNKRWEKPDFGQQDNYPVVFVSWDEATAFCAWLTKREHQAGRLGTNQCYRLPTDAEWSLAIGLEKETGSTPRVKGERSHKDRAARVFSWGTNWPPPEKAGNFADAARRARQPDWNGSVIRDYNDGWVDTAPVGTFPPNQFGLYDMDGNVNEWCQDWYDETQKERVIRGSSFGDGDPAVLFSSARFRGSPDSRRKYWGFRCVMAPLDPTT